MNSASRDIIGADFDTDVKLNYATNTTFRKQVLILEARCGRWHVLV